MACTYELNNVKVFTEVEQTTPSVNISLDHYNDQDTIRLYGPANFTYSIQLSGASFAEARVLMGSSVLLETTKLSDKFTIAGTSLKTGTYPLKIEFISSSGTGSLADHAGGEFIQIWRQWTLIVDISPPPAPVLTKSTQDGFLAIRWTKCKKLDFASYTLYRYGSVVNASRVFNSASDTLFVDSTYMSGYNVTYRVEVKTSQHTVLSNEFVVFGPQAVTYSVNSSDTSITVRWKKTPYPGAFKEVIIKEDNIVRATMVNVADTVMAFKLQNAIIGDNSTVQVAINPRYPGYGSYSSSTTLVNPVGAPKIIPGTKYFVRQPGDVVMIHTSPFLRTYNATMQVVDSIFSIDPSIPYPGTFLYETNGTGIRRRNLVDGTTQQFPTTGPFGGAMAPTEFSVSSGGILSYGIIDANNPFDRRFKSAVVNTNTSTTINQVIVSWEPGGFYKIYKPSDDGTHAFYRNINGIYTVAASLTHLGRITNGSFFAFRPDNNAEIILFGVPTQIVKTSDQTLLRSFAPPAPSYVMTAYDPISKYFLYTKSQARVVYMIHIDTQDVKTANIANATAMINGIVITANGYWKKVL